MCVCEVRVNDCEREKECVHLLVVSTENSVVPTVPTVPPPPAPDPHLPVDDFRLCARGTTSPLSRAAHTPQLHGFGAFRRECVWGRGGGFILSSRRTRPAIYIYVESLSGLLVLPHIVVRPSVLPSAHTAESNSRTSIFLFALTVYVFASVCVCLPYDGCV